MVVFPTPNSFVYFTDHGVRAAQPLLDGMAQRGVDYVELSQEIARYLGDRSYCELVAGGECRGHYNAEGNRVVADIVGRYLEHRADRRHE